jgi:hypothetical protein
MRITDGRARPAAVTASVLVLAAGFIVGLPFFVPLARRPHPHVSSGMWLFAVVLVMVVAAALGPGLWLAIWFRRRWAYVLTVVIVGLDVILFVVDLPSYLSHHGTWHAAASAGLVVTEIVGAALLLRRPAREWFGFGRSERPA